MSNFPSIFDNLAANAITPVAKICSIHHFLKLEELFSFFILALSTPRPAANPNKAPIGPPNANPAVPPIIFPPNTHVKNYLELF